jgi:hypothetical protein
MKTIRFKIDFHKLISPVVEWPLTGIIILVTYGFSFGQTYYAGFKSFQLKDSTRIYKPNTVLTDQLHFRPVELDIWYPSSDKKGAEPVR